jgi:hypothetical protein
VSLDERTDDVRIIERFLDSNRFHAARPLCDLGLVAGLFEIYAFNERCPR